MVRGVRGASVAAAYHGPMLNLCDKPAHPLILPSILAADFARLGDDVADVLDKGADGIHVDIMDGHFVPNLSMGPGVMASLRKPFDKAYFDVHLMVSNPAEYVKPFADAGADHITFHIECTAGRKTDHERDLIAQIKAAGCTAGVCLNPGTAGGSITHLLHHPDLAMVLAMSVQPGFGGQSFMPEVLPKVRAISEALPSDGRVRFEMDGGLSPKTAPEAVDAGIDMVVAGSAVFGAKDRAAAVAAMKG